MNHPTEGEILGLLTGWKGEAFADKDNLKQHFFEGYWYLPLQIQGPAWDLSNINKKLIK